MIFDWRLGKFPHGACMHIYVHTYIVMYKSITAFFSAELLEFLTVLIGLSYASLQSGPHRGG
jgi:hypothetical protein